MTLAGAAGVAGAAAGIVAANAVAVNVEAMSAANNFFMIIPLGFKVGFQTIKKTVFAFLIAL
jgi:hypothetical protein